MTGEIAIDAAPQGAPNVDGRRARRQRGRSAVTEAMIDLVFEGHIPPGADEVAARAGVSVASLFRYFETLDDLRRETTDLYFERYAHLSDITGIGEGTLDERIQNFVDSRLALHATTEPMSRLVRIRAHEVSAVGDLLRLSRATRADQIRQHFDEELRAIGTSDGDDLTTVIATLTSFESWDQMRNDHGRSDQQIRRAWTTALRQVLQ
jgi:AcrR family transcriptional regulator